eukprot:CAMPEP_0119319468 /NCGR_PEP_ID=MMETSP1333-20130426/49487_1 /TAXON_ID=418940 /ORGANISM="Scyphosphaera apsteinii, Strain RCC1455" /LENGTH=187 /DNA_ID=CAMNT_0007325883 /DNA_START=238 /DNA_END=802 /DNA_ORIENTATION=-
MQVSARIKRFRHALRLAHLVILPYGLPSLPFRGLPTFVLVLIHVPMPICILSIVPTRMPILLVFMLILLFLLVCVLVLVLHAAHLAASSAHPLQNVGFALHSPLIAQPTHCSCLSMQPICELLLATDTTSDSAIDPDTSLPVLIGSTSAMELGESVSSTVFACSVACNASPAKTDNVAACAGDWLKQ